MRTIEYVSPAAIKPNPRNAHTHSKKQIEQIARSIDAFGFTVPVIIDETSTLLAGHGCFEAAKLRGLEEIPAIRLRGLSEAKKRALMLADNKIAENAGWDRERLAIELPELADLLIQENLDISITGFEAVEIDTLVSDFEERTADPADDIQADWLSLAPASQRGTSGSLIRIACSVAMRATRPPWTVCSATSRRRWRFSIRPTT
jgi:ParB-like chromosome segregation protein Spo0J